ncbi:hypothetical protein RhiirA1_541181 [Rhizophagus irregularis]|uniref:Uncharacterized protein n=1 Tax=Rhizophagus irregularis TaxID=588596 RepID=A0A2N0R4L5_9GLOM|nr:hypothetical protein RhiirA1_541181 [Rhizophagus irregularis]
MNTPAHTHLSLFLITVLKEETVPKKNKNKKFTEITVLKEDTIPAEEIRIRSPPKLKLQLEKAQAGSPTKKNQFWTFETPSGTGIWRNGIPSGVGFWRNEYFPELEFGEMEYLSFQRNEYFPELEFDGMVGWRGGGVNGSIGTISKGAVRIRPDKSFYDEIGGNFGKKI